MSEKLEWVANDWVKPDYKTMPNPDGGIFMSIEAQREWRSQFLEGDPKPISEKDTVSSLKAMGLIGLYRRVS